MKSRLSLLVTLVSLSAVQVACVSPAEQFYRLDSAQRLSAKAATLSSNAPVIIVGPVSIPTEIDRPQLVTQERDGITAVREQHRWTATLREDMARQFSSRLALQWPNYAVLPYPQASSSAPAARVTLDVTRFEMFTGKEVRSEVVWSIQTASDKAAVLGRRAASVAVSGSETADLVRAQALALDEISQALGLAVDQALAAQRK